MAHPLPAPIASHARCSLLTCTVSPLMSVPVALRVVVRGPWQAPELEALLSPLLLALGQVLLCYAWMPCLIWALSAYETA